MAECRSCGAVIDYQDRLCSSCGAITERGRPLPERFGSSLVRSVDQIAGNLRDPRHRKQVIIGGVALILLLVALTDNPVSSGVAGLLKSEEAGPRLTDGGLPDFPSYTDVFLAAEAEFVVTGPANVRDYPTSVATSAVRTLNKGDKISARQVQAFDPNSSWYKIDDGEYVWGGNLDRIDGPANAAALRFPANLQGRWSSMDTCRGQDLDVIIEIVPDGIRFYESYGSLTRISHDYKERELYHLAMSGEGQTWDETFRFMLSANGLTLTAFDEGGYRLMGTYHKPEGGCDRVSFDY